MRDFVVIGFVSFVVMTRDRAGRSPRRVSPLKTAAAREPRSCGPSARMGRAWH